MHTRHQQQWSWAIASNGPRTVLKKCSPLGVTPVGEHFFILITMYHLQPPCRNAPLVHHKSGGCEVLLPVLKADLNILG
jgi:hypothetical protein